jgi:ribosomal protein L37E
MAGLSAVLYKRDGERTLYCSVTGWEYGICLVYGVAGEDREARETRIPCRRTQKKAFKRELKRLKAEGYGKLKRDEYYRVLAHVPRAGMTRKDAALKSWDTDYVLQEYLRLSENGFYDDDDVTDPSEFVLTCYVVDPRKAAERLPDWLEDGGIATDTRVEVETERGQFTAIWPRK